MLPTLNNKNKHGPYNPQARLENSERMIFIQKTMTPRF